MYTDILLEVCFQITFLLPLLLIKYFAIANDELSTD